MILKERFLRFLRSQGYASIVEIDGRVCALQSFMYTTGLVVGITDMCYERRYCFEHLSDAAKALSSWDGKGHPSGPWIKCKGKGIDLLNPKLSLDGNNPAPKQPRAHVPS